MGAYFPSRLSWVRIPSPALSPKVHEHKLVRCRVAILNDLQPQRGLAVEKDVAGLSDRQPGRAGGFLFQSAARAQVLLTLLLKDYKVLLRNSKR